MKKKRGQIWVETVIYTLIGFAMLGLVLAFAVPRIQELQDKGTVEQSINLLREMDTVLNDLKDPGDQRVLEIGINKGDLTIDTENEALIFELESKYEYSEPGENIQVGDVLAHTEKQGKINIVTLTLDYQDVYDLNYPGEISKTLTKSSVPYKLSLSNLGTDVFGDIRIKMEVIG